MDPNRLAFWLLKDVNKAIRRFHMIDDGDRVAVALSGGKDSLSLLRLLDVRRRSVAERYELVALHVLGDGRGPLPPHQPLVDWLQANGYEHQLLSLSLPEGESLPLQCQRCTWSRRRTLFEAAARLGCNVLALGHHADDLAQTTLLNLIQHGRAETMAPRREYFAGQLRLVRPLCLVAEKELRRYARASGFPPAPPQCPQAQHSRRRLAADLLQQAQRECRDARWNLLRAGLRELERNQELGTPGGA